MTVVVLHGFRWIAERDGEAHATPNRGRPIRTLCGRQAVDERYARPPVTRCTRCQEVADGLMTR